MDGSDGISGEDDGTAINGCCIKGSVCILRQSYECRVTSIEIIGVVEETRLEGDGQWEVRGLRSSVV